jgi:type I restriction enzyme S subunit
MAENSKKPLIRFKGFTDAWEQRKLGEIGYCKSGFGFPDKEQGGHIGIPFFKVSDMNTVGNEKIMEVSNNYVTFQQIHNNNWKIIKDVPAIFFAKVGAAVLLNRKRLIMRDFLLDNNTMAYSINKDNWDENFCFSIFEGINLVSLVQVGALPSYNGNQVENIEVKVPKITEQTKIGNLFKNLDNIIALHQRKYEKLQNVKKALLEKMFPQNASKVPEIRFKGFTNAWEQRKFENVAELKRGLTYSPSDVTTEGIRVLRSSNIDEENFKLCDEDVLVTSKAINVDFVSNEDILITAANGSPRLVGKHAIITGIEPNSTVPGGFMLVAKTDCPYFLNASMSSQWYKRFLNLYVAGGNGSIGNLNKNELCNYSIIIPSGQESNEIGNLFKNLDNLIALHQRE